VADSELSISYTGSGRWAVSLEGRLIHGPLPDAASARWVLDLYTLDVPATDPRWDEVGGKRLLSHRDCTKKGDVGSPCAGAVEYRDPLDPMGRRSPLCQKHWSERVSECRDQSGEAPSNSCSAQ
jgi:hypothetical protein